MATVTSQMVKDLRQATGAGVLDCKRALEMHEGDLERAATYLREQGMAAAAKRSTREAREGLVGSYVHAGSRVAGLIELNCETDFVARTDEFQQLAHDLAMQVVAGKPAYLTKEEVPASVLEQERADYRAELLNSGKAEEEIEQLVEAKVKKFYEENVLLEQSFIKDPSLTVADLVTQKNALLGENLVIRRFVRFEVGG